MFKYTVLMQQSSEGCDYSIACGKDYDFINSDNEQHFKEITDAAYNYLMNFYFEGWADSEGFYDLSDYTYDDPFDDRHLKEFIIISNDTGETHNFDLDEFYQGIKNTIEENKERIERSKDEAEFERLKAKLGK